MIIIVDYYLSFTTKLTFGSRFFKRWVEGSRTLEKFESEQLGIGFSKL